MENIIIRKVNENEFEIVTKMVLDVFMKFEAPDYSEEGIETFKDFVSSKDRLKDLVIFGAYIENELVGIIATRNNGNHIALFFVKEEYQGKKIGKKLFNKVLECSNDSITVNSSPYAVEVYKHLGFKIVEPEKIEDGIRFTKMILEK